ncbi:MAG: DNA polymerase IV [Exilispira sp.]
MQHQKQKIAHLDLDAFFASVEIRDNPELKGKPVIIGNSPYKRGVVCTCSYEARAYGVRSAMPLKKAQLLCPNAIFIKPDIKKYAKISDDIFKLLTNYCFFIKKTGIDEGYLDLTGMIPLYKSYEDLVKTIKEKIYENFALTCSIGVSSSPLISKMASDRCKPDGILILNENEEENFILTSPVETIPFFGKKTVYILKDLGIFYFKDLYKYDLNFLVKNLGSYITYFYLKKFFGEELEKEKQKLKSFSTEKTFDTDVEFEEDLFSILVDFSEELVLKLRESNLKASIISIKVRDEDFETCQRQITLKEPTFNENEIANIAFKIFENLYKTRIKNKKIRLLGLKLSGLIKDSSNLFDTIEKDNIIYKKIDELNKKYGKPIVRKGIIWRKKD